MEELKSVDSWWAIVSCLTTICIFYAIAILNRNIEHRIAGRSNPADLIRTRTYFITIVIFISLNAGWMFIKRSDQQNAGKDDIACVVLDTLAMQQHLNKLSNIQAAFASELDSFKTMRRNIDSIHAYPRQIDNKFNLVIPSPSGTPYDPPRSGWTIFFSMLLIIGGSVLFFVSVTKFNDKRIAIAGTICSSLITFSGAKLYGAEKLDATIKLYEQTNHYWCNDSVHQVKYSTGIRIDSIGAISGFYEGKSKVGYNEQQLMSIRAAIRTQANITTLFMIGEVDHRELKSGSSREFGSNVTLARARAEFIKDQLSALCAEKNITILTMSRGALHTGQRASLDAYSKDRQVVIYGLLN